jgi:hypothetical protein
MTTDEEQRAADYRVQQQRRWDWQQANRLRLRGSPAARRALAQRWQPLLDAWKDRDTYGRADEGTRDT